MLCRSTDAVNTLANRGLYLLYFFAESDPEYLITGTHPYPSAPGTSWILRLIAKVYSVTSCIKLTQCAADVQESPSLLTLSCRRCPAKPRFTPWHCLFLRLKQGTHTQSSGKTPCRWKDFFVWLFCVRVCVLQAGYGSNCSECRRYPQTRRGSRAIPTTTTLTGEQTVFTSLSIIQRRCTHGQEIMYKIF